MEDSFGSEIDRNLSFRWKWSKLYELRWCSGRATFPINGNEHFVPCCLHEDHDGPCVPEQHQKNHDCEKNGCPPIINNLVKKDIHERLF